VLRDALAKTKKVAVPNPTSKPPTGTSILSGCGLWYCKGTFAENSLRVDTILLELSP
jgi:hypothetical protein